MKKKYLPIALLLLCIATALCTACKRTPKDTKPIVYVSIEPLRYFAEQIAGDNWSIISMVPKGSSPETYDPTPSQLVDLAQSKAYLAVGHLGFELQWLNRLKENAPHVNFCDTSKGIDYMDGHHHHEGEEHEEDAMEPHIWTTPSNALILARNIYQLFCQIDSKNTDKYQQNFAKLEQKIQQTDAKVKQLMSQPHQATFGIYHPSLSYFARDYNLTQLSIENEGKEPSPTHLKELIEECKEHHVKTIFIQKEFNIKNAEIISKEVGAKLVTIDPLNYDWHNEVITIAKSLQE